MQDKKPTFSNCINYNENRKPLRQIKGPSLTVPDKVMSMREIFARFAQGLPARGYAGEPIYHGDDIKFDPRKLDLTELHALKQQNDKAVQEFERTEAKKAQEKAEKKQREKFRKEFEEEEKKKTPPAPTNT